MDLNYEDPDREGFPYKRNILSVGTEWGKGTLNRNPQTGARHQKELPHMATALTKPGPGVGSVSVKFQCGVSHALKIVATQRNIDFGQDYLEHTKTTIIHEGS
ncbi:hypothetical protein AXG93_1293s1080 [Marchantia polymorpha subsp. ruderalis]|uniref:Uncharacterized protein n=1 Tax=Marchantia polymorpha subsp. ruderalis TaxID=1480154 RepID=A0A176WF51_MARPO|nr:hypothetical protein AXG93_1293s1080 [Marchantia polymorpha subsp. ruderalis]